MTVKDAGASTGVAAGQGPWLDHGMSFEALKSEAASLDERSRKELVKFLISLGGRDRAERARRLADIRDDPNPERWLTPEEFKTRLERIPEPERDPVRE